MNLQPYIITGEKTDIQIEVIGLNVRITLLSEEGTKLESWEESLIAFCKRIGLNWAALLPFRSLNVRKLRNAMKEMFHPACYEGENLDLTAYIRLLNLRTEITNGKTVETTETPIVQLLAGLGVPIKSEIVIAASQLQEKMQRGE